MTIDHFSGCTTSYSISCTPEPPDYNELNEEDKLRFGFLGNQLRKKGHDLKKAQELAYNQVTCESIPFEPIGG